MKRISFLRLTSFLLLITGPAAVAQESYFNVPESDVAEKKEVIVQQQFSVQGFYRSITTFDYGIAKDWELGANLINLDYEPKSRRFMRNDSSTESAHSPLLMLNTQKIVELPHEFHIGVGGQAGLNLSPNGSRRQFVHYVYANLNKSFANDRHKVTVGVYNGNVRYLGDGPTVGFQAGFETALLYEKLHLIGDWISGSHDVGQLVLGLEVFLGKKLPLAIGWLRQNQDGSSGLVVQLMYRGK